MDDIREYREIIERFARNKVDARIPNSLPLHAAVLIETMFRTATSEMRIFSRQLDEVVYGREEVLGAVARFVSIPYTTLKILLQKPQDGSWLEHNALIGMLDTLCKDRTCGKVVIRNAVGSYAQDDANHFAVMDDDGFRYETSHDNTQAVANFNEPKTAKELASAFDIAFGISKAHQEAPLYALGHKGQ